MSIFMFLLSTVYWIVSVSTLIQLIQVWFLASDPDAHSAPNYLPILNALALVNVRPQLLLEGNRSADGLVIVHHN